MPHLVAWGKILFVVLVFISLISLLSTIGKLLSLLKLDVCFALIHSTAPVPSAVIILVLTSYTTTFGSPSGGGDPAGLAYLFAIDWLVDRFRTVVNVSGDLVVTRIVSEKVNEEQAEQLGNVSLKQ